ncbi:MAG TPA: sigma-70 family RNA polymerase sigma factor [Cyclobacteriaceae bacterium]|nr:sigma-70 family RNA polymerase sigma factor [Cyclobacteriaceae bacterium]
MDQVQAATDRLYKTHFGRLVTSLLSFSNDIDIASAEDLVQESFSAALTEWNKNGIPSNPSGWLYTVCRNKALNSLKKLKTNKVSAEQEQTYFIGDSESVVDDHQLKLLFTCANPDLPPKSQVAITLKYVVNLKVEAIARLLGMTLDGVDKILIRARQKIRSENLLREESMHSQTLKSRLAMVHKIIYLIFNEGYKSSWGKAIIREELCEEALILNHSLLKSGLSDKETMALQALMLFNISRIKSRFDSNGEIVELENQDRSLWDNRLIVLATDFLEQAKNDTVSTYHIEASIAYLHCTAPSFESTQWHLIVKLYQQLQCNNPNPFVEMNYAIALFYSGDRENAFQILNRLKQHPFLNQYFLLNAALGKLHLVNGNNSVAKAFLLQASQQTEFAAEKKLIKKMIEAA